MPATTAPLYFPAAAVAGLLMCAQAGPGLINVRLYWLRAAATARH